MIREGAKVSFVGEFADSGLAIGDQGLVIAASGHASHIRWTTGARVGQIDLVGNDDLVEATASRHVEASLASEVDESLSDRAFSRVAVRDTYDLEGPEGVLAALAEEGHLASLTDVAEEALSTVASRLREDPVLTRVLATLDADEADAFISLASTALLRDAVLGGEG